MLHEFVSLHVFVFIRWFARLFWQSVCCWGVPLTDFVRWYEEPVVRNDLCNILPHDIKKTWLLECQQSGT